jgi:hypothetical protein
MYLHATNRDAIYMVFTVICAIVPIYAVLELDDI